MTLRNALTAALLAALTASSATGAKAATIPTTTSTLTTTITVLSVCYFTTPSYTATYNYDPVSVNATAATTPVTVTLAYQCTSGDSSYGFTFAASTNHGGSTSRQAANGSNLISYGIYSDPGATTLIAPATEYKPSGEGTTTGVVGTPLTTSVYVASPGGQSSVVAGTYTDTVNIVISPT